MYFFHLGHMACLPPSTGNEAPVMKDDSLDARKAITLDTSSTFPGLPKAWVCLQRSRNCTKEQKSFKTKQIRPWSAQYTCTCSFWLWNFGTTVRGKIAYDAEHKETVPFIFQFLCPLYSKTTFYSGQRGSNTISHLAHTFGQLATPLEMIGYYARCLNYSGG